MNVGEDVLVFYNDKASFNSFCELMRTKRHRVDQSGNLKYCSILAIISRGFGFEIQRVSILSLEFFGNLDDDDLDDFFDINQINLISFEILDLI